MKSFNWSFFTLLLLIVSTNVSARLMYWPNYSYATYYHSTKTASNVAIVDCSNDDFILHLDSVKITPDIIVPGGEVTIEATGTLDEPVLPGSVADVTVKLGVVRLLRKIFDICDELEKNKKDVALQCPINDGVLTIIQKVTLPKEVPKGKFVVLVHAFTADEKNLACLAVTADFRAHRRLLQLNEYK